METVEITYARARAATVAAQKRGRRVIGMQVEQGWFRLEYKEEKTVPHKFAPWAYSKLKAFETCPKQFYHMRIAKTYTEPDSEHLLYGNEFHKAAELYVGKDIALPGRFEFTRPVLDSLKNKPGKKHCELKLGLTENLEPCDFFAKDVWWRGVVDLLIIDGPLAWVIDYKTGKSSRYADRGQLELMAMATFKHFPEVKKIRAGLLFVVASDMVREVYEDIDQQRLWADWLKRYHVAEKAVRANVFNPKPSGLCARHCMVLECPHNGRS